MILDENTQELVTRNKKIKLTPNEFRLMQFLIKNKNRNCTYKELIMYIYNTSEEDYVYFKSPLLTIIRRIKKKLKNEDLIIKTIPDYGVFIRYNINIEVKKRIEKFLIEQEILKLKDEIEKKKNKIKLLEESIK
jgi:DNA-binding winged helix-turn-helix (wHTH) protein